MTKISPMIAGALVSLCLATVPAKAHIQVYVSGKGADTGACATPATACRTFAFAIGQALPSSEIKVLDPANYEPVTITKSISIVADGDGPAGIFLTAGNAITINAGANDIVNLRGLTLNGAGNANTGIILNSAGSVTIADCVVRHFHGGIEVHSSGPINFLVSNTVSSDHNPGGGLLVVANFRGLIRGVVDHFTASNNNFGISIVGVGAPAKVEILDSVVANNRSHGLQLSGSIPEVTVRKSVASGNGGAGFAATETSDLTLADSMATDNKIGVLAISNGLVKVFSYGDNEINGNLTDVQGTLTPVAKR